MTDPIDELKTRARLLQRQARRHEPRALARLRRHEPSLRGRGDAEVTEDLRLGHCQTVVAREQGFSSWQHASRILSGEIDPAGFGDLLCQGPAFAFTNQWFADHASATDLHQSSGGYLLAYRRQFLLVTRDYVEAIGVDPDDPDWNRLHHDWTTPDGAPSRRRLYGQILASQLRPS